MAKGNALELEIPANTTDLRGVRIHFNPGTEEYTIVGRIHTIVHALTHMRTQFNTPAVEMITGGPAAPPLTVVTGPSPMTGTTISPLTGKPKRVFSAATRAKLRAAQKKLWATRRAATAVGVAKAAATATKTKRRTPAAKKVMTAGATG
jgi:hypothetical protein